MIIMTLNETIKMLLGTMMVSGLMLLVVLVLYHICIIMDNKSLKKSEMNKSKINYFNDGISNVEEKINK